MGVGSINVWGDAGRFNTLKKGANCKLLVHSDAADASTTFADSVGTHSPGNGGTNAQHDTAQYVSHLGKSSILFDGNGDYITINDHADWDFGTGNLTIEFWVRFSAVTGIHTFYYQAGANDDRVWFFVDHDLDKICLQVVSGSVSLINEYGTWAPAVSTWYHVALIRGWGGVATAWAICVNGTAVHTFTADVTMPNLNGAARFGGGLATTDVYDFSSSAHAATIGSDTAMSAVAYKFGTKALRFDGTDDDISFADSADWELSSSTNYTIDFWVLFDDHAGTEYLVIQYEGAGEWWGIYHVHTSGLVFRQYHVDGGPIIIDTGFAGEIDDSDWHHIALCKVGNYYGLYKDGTRIASTTDTSTDTLTGSLTFGSNGNGVSYFDGSMDEIRISASNVFSVTADTVSFSVPTGGSVPDANTKLLLRTDNYDLAGWMTEIRVVKGTAVWTGTFKTAIGRYV
jgi:hypothetical protein